MTAEELLLQPCNKVANQRQLGKQAHMGEDQVKRQEVRVIDDTST